MKILFFQSFTSNLSLILRQKNLSLVLFVFEFDFFSRISWIVFATVYDLKETLIVFSSFWANKLIN